MTKKETTEIVERGLPSLVYTLEQKLKEGWAVNHSRPPEFNFLVYSVHLERCQEEEVEPLSEEQLTAVKALSPATNTPDEMFSERLFESAGDSVVQSELVVPAPKKPGRPSKK